MVRLEGKIALVTGGASGIGRAAAERFTREGARVCIVDLPGGAGEKAATELGGVFVAADVGDSAAVDAAFDTCERDLGGLDLAFLNAGITAAIATLDELTDEAYERIMRVNVDGVVFGARAAARTLTRRGGGAIIATASLAGLIPFAPDAVYSLTKHAVVGFVRSIAPTLAAHDITANCICPGFVDTPLIGEAREFFVEAGFPLLDPDEIADAVMQVLAGARTGDAWVCQPGRQPEPYRFHDVPGPRVAGAERNVPPDLLERNWPH